MIPDPFYLVLALFYVFEKIWKALPFILTVLVIIGLIIWIAKG